MMWFEFQHLYSGSQTSINADIGESNTFFKSSQCTHVGYMQVKWPNTQMHKIKCLKMHSFGEAMSEGNEVWRDKIQFTYLELPCIAVYNKNKICKIIIAICCIFNSLNEHFLKIRTIKLGILLYKICFSLLNKWLQFIISQLYIELNKETMCLTMFLKLY